MDIIYDSLSYDSQIINDHLTLAMPLEQRINNKLKEESDQIKEQVRKELELQRSKERIPVRETFVGGCGCDGFSSKNQSSSSFNIFDNNKILMILVFVLAVFCIIQYINQQQAVNEMKDLLKVLCTLNTQSIKQPMPLIRLINDTKDLQQPQLQLQQPQPQQPQSQT